MYLPKHARTLISSSSRDPAGPEKAAKVREFRCLPCEIHDVLNFGSKVRVVHKETQ